MASLKKLGFFCGDDKITLVVFEKNAPIRIISSSLGSKSDVVSPLSSNLTEEIQITLILKKMLEDNGIMGDAFYVSLPMKEIILRSFVIPFVKPSDLQNAIKFEATKYIPFDIQDLYYVFHTVPFTEGQNKRLQVILFAARKEVLARYERIFMKVNSTAVYREPYIVSLAKALLFRKEIKPTEHIAFLTLDKNLGRICFIDKGIPQFIREFPIGSLSEETNDSIETLNLKVVNEVGNSFDFYSRQFNSERIDQVLVSSEFVPRGLLETLGTELKLKILKFSPVISTADKKTGQSNDIDAIYALGACVPPFVESLSKFNFIAEQSSKPELQDKLNAALDPYKAVIFAFLLCAFFLIGVHIFFQIQLKGIRVQYNRLTASEGAFLNETKDNIQAELQQNIDKLNQYKNVRTKSNVAAIILQVASHVPKGTKLDQLKIGYNQGDSTVTIDIQGMVIGEDPPEQMAVVDQMFADFKKDKELAAFIKNVNLVSIKSQEYKSKQATAFVIHFS